jgi:hypothetical protein
VIALIIEWAHFSWVQSRCDTVLANLAAKAPNHALLMGEVEMSTSDSSGGVYSLLIS